MLQKAHLQKATVRYVPFLHPFPGNEAHKLWGPTSFQSRLKTSISLEKFNLDLQNSPTNWLVVARLKFHPGSNPGGRS